MSLAIIAIFNVLIEYLFVVILQKRKMKTNCESFFFLLIVNAIQFGVSIFLYDYLILIFEAIALLSALFICCEKHTCDFIIFTIALVIFDGIIFYNISGENWRRELYILFAKTAELFLLLICFSVISKFRRDEVRYFRFSLILALPILINLISFVAIRIHLFSDELKSNIFLTIINFIVALISFILYLCYINYISNNKPIEINTQEKQYSKINNSYLRVLENQNQQISQMLHDTKNHYSAILMMDNLDNVKEYVSAINGDILNQQIIKFSNNKMLDMMLSKYKIECTEKNIELFIEVKTANLKYINDNDLSVIVGNLMDNAVSGAERSKEKIIEIRLNRFNDLDVLSISNSCDDIIVNNKNLPTSKSNDINHGYGMRIIKRCSLKVGAEYDWEYDTDKRMFKSILVFNKRKTAS